MNKRALLIGILLLIVLSTGLYIAVFLNASHRPDNLKLITLLDDKKYEKRDARAY